MFVTLDETSFGRNGRHVYGHPEREQQVFPAKQHTSIPRVSAQTATESCVLLCVGKRVEVLNASCLFFAAFHGVSFLHGSVRLCVNVAFHHPEEVNEHAGDIGAALFLVPAYSPRSSSVERICSVGERHFHGHQCAGESFTSATRFDGESFFDNALSAIGAQELLCCCSARGRKRAETSSPVGWGSQFEKGEEWILK